MKYFDEIFPHPEASVWSPDIPNNDQTGPVCGSFYVRICCWFVIISFICWCILMNIISLLSKFRPGQRENYPTPDPFPGSRTGPSPKLSKISIEIFQLTPCQASNFVLFCLFVCFFFLIGATQAIGQSNKKAPRPSSGKEYTEGWHWSKGIIAKL